MNDIGDLLKQRQGHFDEDRRSLLDFRTYLTDRYGAGACGVRLQDGKLVIMARSSALANQLRLHGPDLLREARRRLNNDQLKLRVTIGRY